jgi:hypothetical protein
MRGTWIALFMSTGLIGCAVQTQYISNSDREAEPGSLKAGAATVYVARTNGVLVWAATVQVDGVEQGTLSKLSFLHFIAPPGRHDILLHWSPVSGMRDVPVNVELKADKTYYLELGTGFMRMVDRSTGEAMIAACKCQDSSIVQPN